MPFNGSGVFAIVNTFVAGTTILSSAVNANFTDIASGLSMCVLANGTQTITSDISMSGFGFSAVGHLQSEPAVTVASDTTCDILSQQSLFIRVSGVATVTSFGADAAVRRNQLKFVVATGGFTMTHNATSLILPGGSPITATVGDTFVAISDTNSNVTVYAYQRSGGTTGSHINVRDYGANPAATGTVNAAAIQAAITAAEAIDWTPTGHSLRPVIYIPAGEYKTNEITTTKPVYIKGDGRNATMLRLDTGRTGSLLTLGVIDRGSTSAEDFDHPRVESMCLVGNRVDSTTTGTSHGIECPDPGWPTSTQYSPSFTGVDLMIEGFTGNGIAAYVNRNLMMLERVICRYNNDNGLYLNDNFDSLISSCEFGNNKNFGIFEDNALNVKVTLCDIYYNDYNVKRLNCSGVSMYIGCTIQAAAKDGFWQAGGYGPIISSCMFLDNSRDTNNTYSNIAFTGSIEVCSVVGCYFQWTTGNRVKYLVSGLSGVTQVAWAGNSFSSINLAYATGTFDQPFKIAVAGDVSGFTVHSTGADQLLYSKASGLIDGISTPTTVSGVAFIFVDSADGDLKIKYGDGTVKLIVVDT